MTIDINFISNLFGVKGKEESKRGGKLIWNMLGRDRINERIMEEGEIKVSTKYCWQIMDGN